MVNALDAAALFTGGSLAALATLLVVAGRRWRDDIALVVFLAAVATNLIAGALGLVVGSPMLRTFALVALVIDPMLLAAVVVAQPYRTASRPIGWTLAAFAAVAAVNVVAVAFMQTVWEVPLLAMGAWFIRPPMLIAHLSLAGAYSFAWLLASHKAATAPTPILRRRAAGVLLAVGIATVPRVALLPVDLGLADTGLERAFGITSWPLRAAIEVTVFAVIVAALLAAAHRHHRDAPPGDVARRAFRWVAAICLGFVAVRMVVLALPLAGGAWLGYGPPYMLRWLIFAPLMVYGVLAQQVVAFRRGARRAFVVLGGLLGAYAAGLSALVLGQAPRDAFLIAAAVLPVAAALGGALYASLHERIAPTTGASRRLDLYRIAIDAHLAAGHADPRDLDRQRRRLGVSRDEARALEHVARQDPEATGHEPTPGLEVAPGLVLGEVLARGGHGVVFAVRRAGTLDPGSIIKAVPDDARGRPSPQVFAETEALRRIRHPAIPRLFDVHRHAGWWYLVQERVDGSTLAGEGTAPTSWLRDLLDALAAAHDAGVVHLDIKPENIIIDAAGGIHLVDFGIAALTRVPPGRRQGRHATARNLITVTHGGTPDHVAPEQRGGEPVGPATDVYQVGLLARRALGNRGTRAPWREVLDRALATDATQRFADARAFRAALPDSSP